MAQSLLNDEAMSELSQGSMAKLAPATEADEPASPTEEKALAIGLHKLMEDLYGDETLPKFANVFHQDQRPLMEVIPDMLQPMLLAAKNEVDQEIEEGAPSSIFFSPGGLLESGVDMLFELAQQLAIPGSEDPDQYAGALMGIYKKAGEHIIEAGDADAMKEAVELGGQMVANSYGTNDLDEAQKIIGGNLKKNTKGMMAEDVEAGLLKMYGGDVP